MKVQIVLTDDSGATFEGFAELTPQVSSRPTRSGAAVLKALWVHAGEVVPAGKDFKAGTVMDQLPSKVILRDSLRLTVNRSCRFVYEVASNRGGRHDADRINVSMATPVYLPTDLRGVLSGGLRLANNMGLSSIAITALGHLLDFFQKDQQHAEDGNRQLEQKRKDALQAMYTALIKTTAIRIHSQLV